jgi:hypothetical protein
MPQTTKKLSRRDALKVLGAAAGATALANLPAKWTTPKLEAGVLPAHAQSSCFGLEIRASGASASFLFPGVPDADSVSGTNPKIWTWFSSHCECVILELILYEGSMHWETSNSAGAGPQGDLSLPNPGEIDLYIGSNMGTGQIVANTNALGFNQDYENMGCAFVS